MILKKESILNSFGLVQSMAEKKARKYNIVFSKDRVYSEQTKEAKILYDQSRFGEPVEGKFQYSLVESLLLLEKARVNILEKKKKLKFDDFVSRAEKVEKNFWIKYCVFRDLRNRGYIVKTALKFGADFRVYDRGVKPGDDHAKWIVYPVKESTSFTWYDFAAKNRVAHSTRKKLLLAVVDDEGDVSYWESSWVKP